MLPRQRYMWNSHMCILSLESARGHMAYRSRLGPYPESTFQLINRVQEFSPARSARSAISAHPALCNMTETCLEYQHLRLISVAHKIIRVNNVPDACMVPNSEFMPCSQVQETRRLSIHQYWPFSFSVLVYECAPFLACRFRLPAAKILIILGRVCLY